MKGSIVPDGCNCAAQLNSPYWRFQGGYVRVTFFNWSIYFYRKHSNIFFHGYIYQLLDWAHSQTYQSVVLKVSVISVDKKHQKLTHLWLNKVLHLRQRSNLFLTLHLTPYIHGNTVLYMWPVKKYDKIGRRNSLDKRKLRRAQRVFLTLAQVSIIARVWTEHINWKEHELWVVSVVVGIKTSKKSVY